MAGVSPRTVPLLVGVLSALGAALAHSQDTSALLPGVEVSRVVLEARVLDGHGRPVLGLAPRDFRLRVDGHAVPLESVIWVPDGLKRQAETTAATPGESPPTSPVPGDEEGRLVVLLFEKDHRGSRLFGLLQAIQHSSELLDQFGPRDKVAVLVFDTQLRLHLDFTSDRDAVERTLSDSILNRWPAPLPPGPEPSLAALIDPVEAREASTAEAALAVLSRALERLPGFKTLLVFGWGVGQTTGGVVTLTSDYGEARDRLNRSRTSVFSMDIVDADYHTLEVTLEQVARDTGGLYLRMVHHPELALDRLARALSGHYVLAFERPPGARGRHEVRVALSERGGTVLTRSEYVD
jgi:VWFA-related protein